MNQVVPRKNDFLYGIGKKRLNLVLKQGFTHHIFFIFLTESTKNIGSPRNFGVHT
jgi:hypothetical protein